MSFNVQPLESYLNLEQPIFTALITADYESKGPMIKRIIDFIEEKTKYKIDTNLWLQTYYINKNGQLTVTLQYIKEDKDLSELNLPEGALAAYFLQKHAHLDSIVGSVFDTVDPNNPAVARNAEEYFSMELTETVFVEDYLGYVTNKLSCAAFINLLAIAIHKNRTPEEIKKTFLQAITILEGKLQAMQEPQAARLGRQRPQELIFYVSEMVEAILAPKNCQKAD